MERAKFMRRPGWNLKIFWVEKVIVLYFYWSPNFNTKEKSLSPNFCGGKRCIRHNVLCLGIIRHNVLFAGTIRQDVLWPGIINDAVLCPCSIRHNILSSGSIRQYL